MSTAEGEQQPTSPETYPPPSLPPLPRLPPEIIENIVHSLDPIDPAHSRALYALCRVSKVVRHWALQALYGILILPRHVREFRKWYKRIRMSNPPFVCAGYTRAFFMAVDDVSRLTSSSAGWESEMLRLLHYCGPYITHLSLWHSESRALLRDSGQVRSQRRAGALQPAWTWGEGGDESLEEEPALSVQDEERERRRREAMPGWLRKEIELNPTGEVARRHAPPAQKQPTRPRGGCRPRSLSLVFALPIFDNEEPELFSAMTIWTRVEELDLYVPVTSHVAKVLWLVTHLRSPLKRLRISSVHASLTLALPPFSQRPTDASLLDTAISDLELDHQREPVKLPQALGAMLHSEALKQALLNEYSNHPIPNVQALERALTAAALEPVDHSPSTWASGAPDAKAKGPAHSHAGFFDDPTVEGDIAPFRKERIRVRIAQGGQQSWGKLKERLWDFRERARSLGDGAWETLGAVDSDEHTER